MTTCGFQILNAGLERFGGEAAEDHAVGDAEARAGQQRDGQFGHHAHVDDGAVAGLEAAGFQDVGEAADQAVQFLVGDHALIAGLAFPEDGDLVLARGGEVAVEAVVGGVDLAAGEPLGEGRVPFEDVGPLLKPVRAPARPVRPRTPRAVRRLSRRGRDSPPCPSRSLAARIPRKAGRRLRRPCTNLIRMRLRHVPQARRGAWLREGTGASSSA